MVILGLDTATLTLSAALVERTGSGDRLLSRQQVPPPTPHSTLLPGLLQQMLDSVGKRVTDLAGVVIGLGPGSFTGLRISLSTAKGICYAARLPLVGASSLAAMALAATDDAPPDALLVPCLDARKGEVYCGLFRRAAGGVEALEPEMALKPEALLEKLVAYPRPLVFGIGREAYGPLAGLPPSGVQVRAPDALALVRLVRELPPFSKEAVFGLEPHYVRPSDSEWTAKPKKSG